MLQSFDLDAFFTRPASPFAPEQRIHHRRAELFERVVVERLDALLASDEPITDLVRDGAALTCAILFGALLDARCWSAWLRAARWPVIDLDPAGAGAAETIAAREGGWRAEELRRLHAAGRLWIDLPPADGREMRRWVADPLTHCLLLRWQRDCARRGGEPAMPAVAVAAFLRSGREDQVWEEWILEALHRAATIKWRMRMPGFLVEANGERGRCVSLPSRRWMALLGRAVQPISVPYSARLRLPGKRGVRQADPILRRIAELLPHDRSCAPSIFTGAANQLSVEARRNDVSPVERLVLLWAADRLDPSRDARQRQRRLAPSTLRERAARLLPILRGAFGGQDPEELEAADFATACNRRFDETPAKPRDGAALSCFTAWLQCRADHLAIAWTGGVERKESGVGSGLITAGEYAALRDRFDARTANGAMARLLVLLGFRAGLRWREALNLRVDDIMHTGRHVELSISHNRDHRLKSPAGRRVLPLHLLMDDGEIAELLGWWRERRAAASARLPDGDPDPRNRRRLFPR